MMSDALSVAKVQDLEREIDEASLASRLLWLVLYWIVLSLGIVLLVPNLNIPYEDDLALLYIMMWPVFGVLIAVLAGKLKGTRPPFSGLLLACVLCGSFHTAALLFAPFRDHDLTRFVSTEVPTELGPHWGKSLAGEPEREARKIRHLPQGSGSYVMDYLYHEGTKQALALTYSGNSPNGPLPNWIVPLTVLPFDRGPQFWLAANQYRSSVSAVFQVDVRDGFHRRSSLLLLLAVALVWVPLLVAQRLGDQRVGWFLLLMWCVLYRPWMAWKW